MRIAIPTLGADGGKSGISQYLIQVLREFARIDSEHRFMVLGLREEAGLFVPPDSDAFEFFALPARVHSPSASLLWTVLSLPRVLRQIRADVVFMPAGNRRLAWSYPCPAVGTVHDFSSLHVAGKYDRARLFYITQVLPRLVRRLDHVLTISESSRRDILQFARVPPERVTVTPLACDTEHYRPAVSDESAADDVLSKYALDAPYFVYVSRLEHPGKNHVGLIEAFNRYRQKGGGRRLLVLAGSDWSGALQVHAAAERSPFSADIRFLGFVPQEAVPSLYRNALAMVFPSLYEGFGLPVLEAMACGAPVACSNRSSLPEVAGDAAILFNPEDADSIAEALYRFDSDTDLRHSMAQRGLERVRLFSWRKTAEATLDVLEKVFREKAR